MDHASPPDAKIALFRSLFRGRDDVYARRFENRRTGKSGYAPACANEWVRGLCEKPRIKCGVCPHRRFLPLTDEVIRCHLLGRDSAGQPFVAGVYPLFPDDSCAFLAVDFDEATWQDDAHAFAETCRRLSLPALLERSRSGHGGHVWFFFDERVPATLARRLGSWLLTETMERRPDPDLDLIVRNAEHRGRVLGVRLPPPEEGDDEPWAAPPSRSRTEARILGPLPETLELIVGNDIFIAETR